jgi:hypothetical protein
MVGSNSSVTSTLALPFLRRIPRIGPNAALLLAGLILPNALSFATLFHVIDIGLPPRPYSILLYLILTVSARRILGLLRLDHRR